MTTAVAVPLIDMDVVWEDTLTSVISFIPKLIVFLVVFFIAWLIAKAVAKFLTMVLQRLGFGRLLERAGADQLLSAAQIEPIQLISKLAYYFILLIGLQLALTAFGPSNPVSDIVNGIVAWLPSAFVAIIIIVVAAAVANAVRDILSMTLSGLSYGALLAKLTSAFIIALGVIAGLNQMGIGLSVTLPVLIAVLATIGGILVVGVGGGLIGPMRGRWESWLDNLESDAKNAKGANAGAGAHAAQPTTPPPAEPPPAP